MQQTPLRVPYIDTLFPPSTKQVYGLTYMLLRILLLCTMSVSGSFAAALPLHFPPPPVSHPNDALENSKNTESSRTPLSTLQKKPKPAEPLVSAYFMHHSPIPSIQFFDSYSANYSSAQDCGSSSLLYHCIILSFQASFLQ